MTGTGARLAVLALAFWLPLPAHGRDAPSEGESGAPRAGKSPPDERFESPLFAGVRTQGGLSLHRDMFALPLTWSDEFSRSESEVVFQLSAKVRLHRSRFFFAYTQRSFWQAFDSDESSPFRATDHNPEVFYRMVPSNSRFERWGFDAGLDHQSNGRSGEESRSWNRVVLTPQYHGRRTLLQARLWYRIPEDECLEESCRDDGRFDDNPDITDFMGYGEVHLSTLLTREETPQMLHVMLRGNASTGKGAFSVDYSYPGGSQDLYWFARYFEGYGESLIDYDRSMRRVGIGILLKR
jgi:phospholipase A1